MTSMVVRLLVVVACVVVLSSRSYAAGAGMVEEPKPKTVGTPPTAEARYNQGEALAKAHNWKDAEVREPRGDHHEAEFRGGVGTASATR